jgi:agmatine/peptidylarginine deiminase
VSSGGLPAMTVEKFEIYEQLEYLLLIDTIKLKKKGKDIPVLKNFQFVCISFSFSGWGGVRFESTWYVDHYLAYCTSPG